VDSAYFPAAQSEQVLASVAAANVPAEQVLQLAAPEAENWPPAQLVQFMLFP